MKPHRERCLHLHATSRYCSLMAEATKSREGTKQAVLCHEPEAVIYARKKAGLSQAEAATALGISPALMNMIESGVRSATPARLQRMADVFNCPVVVLERKRTLRRAEEENRKRARSPAMDTEAA